MRTVSVHGMPYGESDPMLLAEIQLNIELSSSELLRDWITDCFSKAGYEITSIQRCLGLSNELMG